MLRSARSNEPAVFCAAALAASIDVGGAFAGLPVYVLSGIGDGFGHAARLFLGVAESAVEIRGCRRPLGHDVPLV